MFCFKCGENLPDEAEFCIKCGTKTVTTIKKMQTNIQTVYNNQQEYQTIPQPQLYQQPNYQNMPYGVQQNKPPVFGKTLKIIGIIFVVLFVIGLFIEEETTVTVKVNDYDLIRNSYLNEYSTTKTINEAFNNYFSNPQWKDSVQDGQAYVIFKGYCTFLGDNTQTTITFWIDKNKDLFNVEHIQMGMFSWEQDNVLDVVLIIGFLTEVFE